MNNTISKYEVYRSKSIMHVEAQVGVNYNVATPMIQFKFATRQDMNSPGTWDVANSYWFPNIGLAFELVAEMQKIIASPGNTEDSTIKFSNPKKQKYFMVRKNIADNGGIWYVITFLSGPQENQTKINCSCNENEFKIIYNILKTMVMNFPVIGQLALMRYDYWYQNVGHKYDANNGTQSNNTNTNNYQKSNTNNYQKSNNYSGAGNQTSNGSSGNMYNNSHQSSYIPDDDIPF